MFIKGYDICAFDFPDSVRFSYSVSKQIFMHSLMLRLTYYTTFTYHFKCTF